MVVVHQTPEQDAAILAQDLPAAAQPEVQAADDVKVAVGRPVEQEEGPVEAVAVEVARNRLQRIWLGDRTCQSAKP